MAKNRFMIFMVLLFVALMQVIWRISRRSAGGVECQSGQTALIEAIEQDYEDRVHVAVTVDALTTASARNRKMNFRSQDGREKILALAGRERQRRFGANPSSRMPRN